MPVNSKAPIFSKKSLWLLGAVILATAIIYFPSLDNEFMYEMDDGFYLIYNPVVAEFSIDKTWELLTSFYVGNFHPLTMLTYVLGGASF